MGAGERATLGVDLVESTDPFGMRCDGGVGRRIEVAVPAVLGSVNDDGIGAVALNVGMAACVEMVAEGELVAKPAASREPSDEEVSGHWIRVSQLHSFTGARFHYDKLKHKSLK